MTLAYHCGIVLLAFKASHWSHINVLLRPHSPGLSGRLWLQLSSLLLLYGACLCRFVCSVVGGCVFRTAASVCHSV